MQTICSKRNYVELDLRGTPVTDAAAKEIAKMKSLEKLRIVANEVDNATLELLCKELNVKDLDLQYATITREIVNLLCAQSQRLDRLHIRGNIAYEMDKCLQAEFGKRYTEGRWAALKWI